MSDAEKKSKHLIRPYGDRKDDGVVQVSFVLPVPVSEKAKEAAAQVARKMGLGSVLVSAMERNEQVLRVVLEWDLNVEHPEAVDVIDDVAWS